MTTREVPSAARDSAALRRGLREAIAIFERMIAREEARECLCGGECIVRADAP